MREQRFKPYSVSTTDGDGFVIGIQKEDGTVMSITDASEMLNEQQATISQLKEENEQLKNELRKEKSLREYSDSMYGADLIVNIRFSNGEWKADVSVIDDE